MGLRGVSRRLAGGGRVRHVWSAPRSYRRQSDVVRLPGFAQAEGAT